MRIIPSYNWVTEVNGLGTAYRTWLRLPSWLPLPFYCDHGVCYSGAFEDHEAQSRPKLHFTWTLQRYQSLTSSDTGKEVVRIPSPWVMYRKEKFIEKSPGAKGTLIFLPHSLPNSRLEMALEDYVTGVLDNDEFPQPYMFIIHPHDMKKGAYKSLSEYEIPIVTFGDNTSTNFIANFYETVKNFSHAVSARPGSELYYCHELGLKFRRVEVRVNEAAEEDRLRKVFDQRSTDTVFQSLLRQQNHLFDAKNTASDRDRDAFVSSVLSLDLATNDQTDKIRKLVLRHLPKEACNYFAAVSGRVAGRPKAKKARQR